MSSRVTKFSTYSTCTCGVDGKLGVGSLQCMRLLLSLPPHNARSNYSSFPSRRHSTLASLSRSRTPLFPRPNPNSLWGLTCWRASRSVCWPYKLNPPSIPTNSLAFLQRNSVMTPFSTEFTAHVSQSSH